MYGVWELLFSSYCFINILFLRENDDKPLNTMLHNISNGIFIENEAFESTSDVVKDFITNVLQNEPSKRFTSQECLSHEFFGTKHSSSNESPTAKKSIEED
ncbi:hypothetical protein QTN25_004874 [Entamoeba marina]